MLELPMVEDAVRKTQPAHERVLVRRDVEQAMEAPAEVIFRLRVGACAGLPGQASVGVERIFGALPFLLVRELPADRDGPVLRFQMRRVRAARLRRGGGLSRSCPSRAGKRADRGAA